MQKATGTTSSELSSDISDHLLLDRYLSNRNPESFMELVRRHSGLVFGTCLRITHSRQDAEELTQECFFDLVRHASQIRTSLVGWLHQSATNRAFNRVRDERRRKDREYEAGHQRVTKAEEQLADDTSWNDIEPLIDQALLELPEQLRTPILMHYVEGATQETIASTLGVHQSTVSRRLSDGLELLRARLRGIGVAVSATVLVACFESETALAAPSTMSSALAKIGLAGVGTAKGVGTSQFAWLTGIVKGAMAILLLPLAAGVVWGEVVFLIVLVAASVYLGLRRPEWFRVLCFTRQFPNIYEWPFFPLKRWTWKSPPKDWRVWMAASIAIGIELVSLSVISPVYFEVRQGSLLLMFAGCWLIFIGIRIWNRVQACPVASIDNLSEPVFPIDGALLLTYAMACIVLIAKLCVSPLFLSPFSVLDPDFWRIILCAVVWSTVLLFGSVVAIRRLQQWISMGTVEPIHIQQITTLSPPCWLLTAIYLVPTSIAAFITYIALIQDVYPVFVPFGADALSVARRQMLGITLSAMDFLVLAILPLSYLYRRIPHIVWGLGFGVLGLMSIFHLGFFNKSLITAPKLLVQPTYARAPLMEVSEGNFVFSTSPRPIEIGVRSLNSSYMGKVLLTNVRIVSAATITISFRDQSARLEIPHDVKARMAFTEVTVMIQVRPHNFENGEPTSLLLSLIISDAMNRQNRVEGIELSIPNQLTPDDWREQFELHELLTQRSFALGESVNLGTVQGSPLILTVKPQVD